MFDHRFEAKWGQPKLVSVNANHENVQDLVLKFEAEFSDDIAAGIGDFASAARAALLDGDAVGARLPIGNVIADVKVFDDGGKKPVHTFKDCEGVKAVAKVRAPKEDEDPEPTVVFEMRTTWADADLLQVGRLFGKQCGVEILRRQQQLEGVG
jgi:hypothetical protein